MNFPHGLTEDVVLAAIDNAVNVLARSFRFGIYDVEDIKQEARIMGLEAVPRWDRKRPLENFLYSHIRNRLINFKRNKFRRNDPPCPKCHQGVPHEHGPLCEKNEV